MDVSDHQSVPKLMKNEKKSYNKGNRKSSNNSLKVVYISSPMKVKTSASKFRSLVQRLTGKNSDISQYIEEDSASGAGDFHEINYNYNKSSPLNDANNKYEIISSISTGDTSNSLEPFVWSMENLVDSQRDQEHEFAGIFSSSPFYDELDVLGSCDELYFE